MTDVLERPRSHSITLPTPAPPDDNRSHRATWLALGIITVVGTLLRLRGLTTGGLWRDDAWVAMSSRVGLGTAWHMWLTAPGFFFIERTWIALHLNSTVWDQMPPLFMGIAAMPAAFALTRYFRFPRWLCLGAALTICVSPTCMIYSTRIKEYGGDFLLACLILGLGEAARRNPGRRELVRLGLITVCSFAISASTLPVILGVWFVVAATALRDPQSRRRCLMVAGPAVVACLGIAAIFDSHLSPVIRRDFVGNYFNLSSPHAFVSGACAFISSLYVRMIGLGDGKQWGPPLLFVVVSALIILGLRSRRDMLAPALVMGAALVACALGEVPLGTGRTDVVLYPALLLLIASGIASVHQWLASRITSSSTRRMTFGGTAAVMVAALLIGGIGVANAYPATDTRALAAVVSHQMKPGDHIVVDELMRYPWAYYEDTPLHLAFSSKYAAGFTVISTQPRVFIAPSEYYEGGSDPKAWARGFSSYSRLWFVETPPLSLSPLYKALLADGWHPLRTIQANGCAAILLERSPG